MRIHKVKKIEFNKPYLITGLFTEPTECVFMYARGQVYVAPHPVGHGLSIEPRKLQKALNKGKIKVETVE